MEIRIDTELFTEARVIACTLVGAASRVLERKRFSSLFIDEAAQAIEAACWIAISRADRVILAGDHCQLPPTIKCIEAARGGLGPYFAGEGGAAQTGDRVFVENPIPDA